MKKVRIYDLSKQIGISNKELMKFLDERLDVKVKSHSSSIDEETAEKAKKLFQQKEKVGKPAEKPVPSKKIAREKSKKPGAAPKKQKEGPSRRRHKKKPPEKSKKESSRRGRGVATATIAEKILAKEKKQKSTVQTKVFPRPTPRKKRIKGKSKPPEVTKKESTQKWLELPEVITVGDLAQKLDVAANEIIKALMKQGVIATINQSLNFEDAAQIAKQYGYKIEKEEVEEEEVEEVVDESLLAPRPPVVTVLGHVDHGKTSLLDAIRNTNVIASESGGITQRIGASTIDYDGRKIVFIDTPGHEAFTAMRARGAQVTDIAVLVIAADDGIMPQTIEAIDHVNAAGVPIIVAINKIDKPEANPERVKQQMAEYDLIPEDWGGETVTVPVSAKTRDGLDDLLEMILLVSDLEELKANPDARAEGTIIESRMDKGFGPVATVIVQNGTLKKGDSVVVGNEWGRIRFMIDDKGKRVQKVTPSLPAEIVGLQGVPEAGDKLKVVEDEKIARAISESRQLKQRTDRMQESSRASLEDLFLQMKQGETKDLNIIIKADSKGSLEALKHSLLKLTNEEVRINVIHGGVGAISESDVVLATASNAIIIGFNVRPDPITRKLVEQEKIDIRLYRVIYHVIEDVKAAMVGMLEPEYEEVFLGRAEVRETFKISKVGTIAGTYVLDGKIKRNAMARILRDNVVVHEGKIDSLRRFKEDVAEVAAGYECGIFIDKYPAIQPGDIIEAYTVQEVERELPQSS